MKGQGKAIDTICIIVGAIVFISLFFLILSNFLDMLTKQLVGTSGEVWAKQASGVITLVGAATHNAKLSYPFSKDIAYTINIENRLIQVISHYKTGSEASPNVPIGIELGKVTLENTHGITIEKKLKEGKFVYSVGKYE